MSTSETNSAKHDFSVISRHPHLLSDVSACILLLNKSDIKMVVIFILSKTIQFIHWDNTYGSLLQFHSLLHLGFFQIVFTVEEKNLASSAGQYNKMLFLKCLQNV